MLNTTDFFFFSRDNWIRTSDLYVPNVARYQLRHIPIANCDANLSVFFKNQNKKNKKNNCLRLRLETSGYNFLTRISRPLPTPLTLK